MVITATTVMPFMSTLSIMDIIMDITMDIMDIMDTMISITLVIMDITDSIILDICFIRSDFKNMS